MPFLSMSIEDSHDLDLTICDYEHIVLVLIASSSLDTLVINLLFVQDVFVLVLEVNLKGWLLE